MPEPDDVVCAAAALKERFDVTQGHTSEGAVHVEVSGESPWPFLCVAQYYWPGYRAGCNPGFLLVQETDVLFIGAGERLLAYDLRNRLRLWDDRADLGFHHWYRHDKTVVMSAETELAAWDIRGGKRWSTRQSGVRVEPPWEFRVQGDIVYLDVMGAVTAFSLITGPTHP
jgi:hypothetical protein